MTRGILIAGNESSLFSALGREAARRVKSYAAAPVPPWKEGEGRRGKITPPVLEWNPPSPISARTLVLAAVNKLEHIDDAILVCAPPAYRRSAGDLSPAEVDRLVDFNIKGWFFLVKEIISLFKARERGSLALVLSETGAGSAEEVPDLIGPAASAAFKALARGILLSSLNVPYTVTGFSSSEPGGEEAFAAFIFKTLEGEKKISGKWHKFGKLGLFGR
ncbi:MAG: hypothetical protein LBQ44_09365 [Treponema sp.]|jgi:NAD(P)-dependent dehydrogenase (short-subunit alcohol dehydrogenase family)|nr:hypothetical protein [Treponema sp.]